MSFLFGGDDQLIKRLTGVIFVLLTILVVLIFAFGIVTFNPNSKQDFACTYTYHPMLTTRSFQLDEPLFPRVCHG